MHHGAFPTSGFSDALVILGAAGLVIPAFARFRVTPVIGFILIGILVGPGALGGMATEFPFLNYVTISNPEAIEPFAELGVIMLLFSIGLELSFRRLWTLRRLVFGVGASELIFGALLIGGALYLIGQPPAGAIGLGLALALSSTALVLPLTNLRSPVGRSALAMLLFEDVAIVPIIFALGIMAPHADADGVSGFAITVAIGVLTVAAMLILGRMLLPRLFAQAARTKSPELFLSASLLVVIVASLVTTAAGLSPVMGALIAGILIAETDYRDEVEVITEPLRGLGLGIFLITVGMSLDLRVIARNWEEIALAVLGVFAAKMLVTGVLLRLSGARRGVAAETAVLMASPSETTLIVLGAAAAAQVIQPQTAAFWQVVTAIGLTVTPLLAKLGRLAARKVDVLGDLDVEPDMAEERTVIIGFGRVGRLVAQMLAAHQRPYVAVDSNIDTVAAARREGFTALFGDVARPQMVDRLKLDRASAVILTMDDPVLTIRLTRTLRDAFAELPIIARARDATHAAELYRAGATDAVPETLEASLQLSEAVLVGLGIAMGPVIASIHEKRAELRKEIMERGDLAAEPKLVRRRLRDAAPSAEG